MCQKAVGSKGVPDLESHGLLWCRHPTCRFQVLSPNDKMSNQWRLSIISSVFKARERCKSAVIIARLRWYTDISHFEAPSASHRLPDRTGVPYFGFLITGYGTMDYIFSLRVTMETLYSLKNTFLHLLFLGIQEAFDCMPYLLIRWTLPEGYIYIFRNLDSLPWFRLRSLDCLGDTTAFSITVGFHEGSVNLFLFSVILTHYQKASGLHLQSPWLFIYGDNIDIGELMYVEGRLKTADWI